MDLKQAINGLHFNNLKGDIYGGITAAVVALPLALAFGVSSGAGAAAGLYGAICVGFFAAVFGGTPAQISGPTGPMTVIMAAIYTQYAAMDPVQGPALAFTVVIMAGLIQMGLSALRIGTYINYVPLPVISGFMSGIGVIIILIQLGPLLGSPSSPGPIDAIYNLPSALSSVVLPALLLGAITLLVVYLTPKKVSSLIPAPLLALIVGTLLALFIIDSESISILGNIPTGLPNMVVPIISLELLPGMIKSATALALLGAIDSLLTSLVADNITHTHHKSNRELFGQGIGNTIAGLFGGLPGAGATIRTVVNVKSGGQTPISGALHALILLCLVLGLAGVAKYIPHVVLAGILIKVGTDIIDWEYFRRIPKTSKTSVAIMLLVFLLTVFVDLITAFAVGMICASLVFLKRQSDQQISSMRLIRNKDSVDLSESEISLLESCHEKAILFRLGGPVSFGAAKQMVQQINQLDHYDVLVLDLENVSFIDTTTARAIEDIIRDIYSQGRTLIISSIPADLNALLKKDQTMKQVPKESFYPNLEEALTEAKRRCN